MKIFRKFLIFCVFIWSVACSKTPETEVVQVFPTTTIEENTSVLPYPGPQIQPELVTETYPTPLDSIFFSDGNLPQAPDTVQDPEPGKAALSGVLFSFTTNITIPQTNFYLREAIGSESDSLPPVLYGPQEGDIVGTSNEKGEVFLINIPPGSYFLVVESPPYSWAVVLNSKDDQDPKLFVFESGQSVLAGVMYLSWP